MSQNYRALTRAYRPQNFEDIVSQEHVTSTLQNAIKQNRLSHAYMFCGPRGVGKTTMARVLARTINEVDNQVDGEALNQTLNIVEIDAASNNKVEDIHHLRESVRIPPQNGRYKIYIVDEVHMLSKAAFNALLKTLEEPPEHAIFIFATTEPHKVLPTILSRVQRFDFRRISVSEIVQRLRKISIEQGITVDEESLHVIAKKADGALRDALGLMDQAIAFCGMHISHSDLLQALNVVGTERLFEFTDHIHAHSADAGLTLIHQLLQEGYDIQEFLVGLAEHLRNLYIAHYSEQLYLVEASDDTKNRYAKQAKLFSREDIMRMLHFVSETQIKIKDAQQPRIQFEIMLIKLAHMGRSEEMNALITQLEDLKKNFSNQISGTSEATTASTSNESEPAVSENDKPTLTEQEAGHATNGSAISDPSEILQEEPALKPQSTPQQEASSPNSGFNFLGAPSLGSPSSKLEASIGIAEPVNGHAQIKSTVPAQPVKIELETIKDRWEDFLKEIKDEFPLTLHLQVQRAEPASLKGIDLTLKVEHSFAQKMIEEQKVELGALWKKLIGASLRLQAIVERSDQKNTEQSLSPYERFKQLQQKDPIVKHLVEMLGAELEY